MNDPHFAFQPAPAAVIDLRGIVATFRRRWRWIAGSVFALTFAALGAALTMPPRYDATAKILLDPRNLQVFQNDINPTAGTGEEATLISESQLQVVRSTSVLTSVVQSEKLAADPEFGSPRQGLLATFRNQLLGSPDKDKDREAETPESRALRALDRAVSVRRPDKTFVIEIGISTESAEKSARIANAVADAFLKELTRTRTDEVERASGALEARLGELRERLQVSEAAVERYRRNHDLVGASGRLVGEQQLTDLTNQVARARSRTAETAARVEQIQKVRRSGDLQDATVEAVQSPAIAALRATLAEAKRAEADAALVYGPRHPANAGMAQRVRAARQQLDDELGRIARTATTDYDRARAAEANLDQRITALKKEAAKANEAQVQLRELEREAASNRGVYEAFLNRAKDLQQRYYLDTTNARTIKQATPPVAKAGISKLAIIAGGLVVGLLLGLALALLREQFDPPAYETRALSVWREPEPRYLPSSRTR
ncbi:GumC family protein [Methylobacterium segetis]|uniref:GumC family protein n=1 Tax=Methylobacterium segetis TaxID=2488750 RepID=UPI001404F0FD|nr:GumC family protein [Methylobacterium segetis]